MIKIRARRNEVVLNSTRNILYFMLVFFMWPITTGATEQVVIRRPA